MSNPLSLTTEEYNRFLHHPPVAEGTKERHEAVRETLQNTATTLTNFVPQGRHRSLMLTALQEAMMWANAAVAMDGE